MRSRPDLSPPKPVKRPIHACLPYALALLTLVVGAGSTAFGVGFLGQQNEAKARSLFEECLDRIEREIRYRFALPVHMLNGVTGLYAASEQVEREEFDS